MSMSMNMSFVFLSMSISTSNHMSNGITPAQEMIAGGVGGSNDCISCNHFFALTPPRNDCRGGVLELAT